MPQYTRRALAMGNTATPVLSQPEMRGSVKKNSSNEFADLPVPSELVIETENPATSGGISVVFSPSRAASDVIDEINTTMAGYATAEEAEGCLTIKSVGVGDGAYVRVRQPISGFDDASSAFGYETYPHPSATVAAGDLEDAPVRPRQQSNPIGTKFIAIGEDRVGAAYNRALHLLGANADTLYTWLRQPVARLVKLEVDETTHAAQVVTNADGTVDQVDLTDLSVFDATLSGKRLCVGGSQLSRNSTLANISRFFAVLDSDGKQVPAGDATVRVGAVTRGQRIALMPTFTDEYTAPTSPLSDTAGVTTDGGNALGVSRTKHASVVITEIRQRTTVVCAGATFQTSGVQNGDVATITGAAVTSPFSHDGTYYVDVVVSEEELVLRPHEDSGHVRELNPAVGSLGSVTITSGGQWERDLWVSFEPSLPRFPANGKVLLVIPVEEELGALTLADMLEGDVRSSADVSGWTLTSLWKNLTFDGVYQGQGAGRGSGFFGKVTHKPVRFDLARTAQVASGSVDRVSTGTATLDANTLRLTAAATDRFDQGDVGKTIQLTAGPFITNEPWTIVRLIDNATVELAPPLMRAGYQSAPATTVSVTSWRIMTSDAVDVYGCVHLVSPEYFGEGDDAPAPGGFMFSREQRDQATTDPPTPGLFSFLHLERVRLDRAGTNITVSTVAANLTTNDEVRLSFDPEDTYNIVGETHETRTVTATSPSFVRVLNGKNAGLYRVKGLKSATVSYNAVTVQALDGTPVVFEADTFAAQVAFYNATIATSAPIYGGPGAAGNWMGALSLFVDGYEQDADFAVPLRVGWRGDGTGIYAWLNDPEFKAYDNGDGADGAFVSARLYAPAEGVDVRMTGADSGANDRRAGFAFRGRAFTNRHDYALSNPGSSGSLFHTVVGYTGYLSQTGKDPTLVLVKHDGDEATDGNTAYSKLTPSANLLVSRAGAVYDIGAGTDYQIGPTGRGSAAEYGGSVYVYANTFAGSGTSRPAWAEGGVFVEDTVGAGRRLYPMTAMHTFEDYPYTGTGTYEGWQAPTELGTSGQVYPPNEGDSSPAAELLAPDYTKFNYPHSGIAHISDPASLAVPLTAPFNRFVGCRFLITDPSADLADTEFAIVGVVMPDANELYLALYNPTETIGVDSGYERYFKIYGQRWHEAHINIADYFMIGTARERGTLENVPVVVLMEDALHDEMARAALTAATDPDLQTIEALSPYSWSGGVGVRIGLAGALASMPNVDVTLSTYAGAISWPNGGYWFIEHGWAIDSFEPRGTFPNRATISMASADDPESPTLGDTYKGSLVVDDVAISYPSGGTGSELFWSANWGGSLHLRRTTSGTQLVRIWRPGHSLVIEGHVAVKITAILRVQDSKSIVFALRRADGTLLVSQTVSVSVSTTPQEISAELRILDEDLLHKGAIGTLIGGRAAEMVFPTVDIFATRQTIDTFILELRAEQLTKPVLQDGPLVVAGPVLAHGFRYTNPVRGYQTVGPMSADMLCGPHFGIASGGINAILDKWPSATLDHIGVQELDGMPGRIRANVGGAGDIWYQVVAPRDLFFQKGMHAAAITLNSGAYDPVWYIWNTSDPTEADQTLRSENFQFPGKTGFVVPLEPPHGALLTSLAVSMSFRPHYQEGNSDLHWGVFRTLYADNTVITPGDPLVQDALDKTALDTSAGVYVELWRHNNLDMGIEEDQNAEFSEFVPQYGFSERLARLTIDLSEETPPSWATNLVDPAALPTFTGYDIYAGSEHFERRSWDLLQTVDAADHHTLRVDRRHYSYFLVITFWGGPRRTSTYAGTTIYQYVDNDGWDKWPSLNTGTPPDGSAISIPTIRMGAGYPGEYGGLAEAVDFPPQVKFRGARIGWITDRGGHGGWGS